VEADPQAVLELSHQAAELHQAAVAEHQQGAADLAAAVCPREAGGSGQEQPDPAQARS